MYKKLKVLIKFLLRPRLQITSDVVNRRIRDFHYTVTETDIRNYNSVTDKIDPARAHPLFYTRISWQLIENLNKYLTEPIDGRILETIVHQSEHITIHKQLTAPAQLRVESKVWSLMPYKKGTKMAVKFSYYNGTDLLAVEYARGLLFGVKCNDEGSALGEIPKPTRTEANPLWQEKLPILRQLPYEYAEKTDINADIHTNPEFAKALGLPDIIVQGTCTFAKAVSLISRKELHDDTAKIKSLTVNFIGMLVPPNEITVRLLKKEEKKLYFDVLNDKQQPVLKGGEIEWQ